MCTHVIPEQMRSSYDVGSFSACFKQGRRNALANYIIQMVEMGFGLSREDVMHLAFVIADKSGKKHPLHNGMAGRRKFDGFRTRRGLMW